jgi:hypothetical protein
MRSVEFAKNLIFLRLIWLPIFAHSAPNEHFGFVGTGGRAFAEKFDLPYYTLEGNYHPSTGNLFSSVHPANDPAPGKQVVREVAKLNVRIDGLGESNGQFQTKVNAFSQALVTWYLSGSIGTKPRYTWYLPDVVALASAEESQIVATMDREKNRMPPITGTVWEIGNEPNLFPALTPQSYAALFTLYYKIIKTKDPNAKIAFGSLFLREPAEDLRPRMEETLRANLVTSGLVEGTALFNAVYEDIRLTLFSRIFASGTLEYTKACFAALDPKIQPDLFSVHVYPYDDRPPSLGVQQIKAKLDSLLLDLDTFFLTKGLKLPIWVTEFGNINPALNTPIAVATMASGLIDAFEDNPTIHKWFYYKATGADQQFTLLPNSAPPLTRLAVDSAFEPTDGDFPCGRLNAVGHMYFFRATHKTCEEKIGFELPNSEAIESDVPPQIRVRLDHIAFDTVTVDYVLKKGSALNGGVDFSLIEGALRFLPGETEKMISFSLQDDGEQEGDENFVIALRNTSNAGLSPDSLHVFSIHDNDNTVPFAPTGLSAIPKFTKILVIWNPSQEADLCRYYLYQGTSADTLVLVDSTLTAKDTSLLCSGLKNGKAYFFKVQAMDSAQQIGPFSPVVFSMPVNKPPSIVASTLNTAYEEKRFVYRASGSDPETTPILGYKNYPNWLMVQGDSLVGTPTYPVADTTFLVTITDGENTDSVAIQLRVVSANHNPIINSILVEKPELAEGDATTLQAFASDLDHDSLQFTWLLGGADTLGQGAEIIYRPGFSSGRNVEITLIVRDDHELSEVAKVGIKVRNTALPPLILNLPKILNVHSQFVIGWPLSGRDPDLDSNYQLELGIFNDSALIHFLLGRDSLKVGNISLESFVGIHDLFSGKAWIVARAKDAKHYQTGWSVPVQVNFEAEHATDLNATALPQKFSLVLDWNGYGPNSPMVTVYVPGGRSRLVPMLVQLLDANGRNTLWHWQGNLTPGRHDFQPLPGLSGLSERRNRLGNKIVEMATPGIRKGLIFREP